MGKHFLRPLSERSQISGTYVSGARPCGYKLRVETSLAAMSKKVDRLELMNSRKGVRVYWPDKKSVTVERNVYFDRTSASHPKGEIDGLIGMKANAPVVPNTPSAPSSSQTTEPPAPVTSTRVPSPPPAAEPVPEEPPTEKCI